MLDLLWKNKIGNGVIDCAKCNNIVVSGDVNGDVIVSDYDGNRLSNYHFDLPVWGVDIGDEGNLIAVGLASKVPPKGALIMIELGKKIFEKNFNSAVWDVKIIQGKGFKKVVASTWGDGLGIYNVDLNEYEQVVFENNLFGISVDSGTIYITSSGEGVYEVDLADVGKRHLISFEKSACYKNIFVSDINKIVYGSATDIISIYDVEAKSEKHYKTLFAQICGIGVLENRLFYGDLLGNFSISNIASPNIPILYTQFSGSIWSVVIDSEKSRLFIACGDGNLYCFRIDIEKIKSAAQSFQTEYPFDPSILKGTRVFICYASEDRLSATTLFDGLKSVGCIPWMDTISLLPGQDWKLEIRRAIQSSDFVIICLSKVAVQKRGFVQKEIKDALEVLDNIPEGHIYLIPLRIDDCQVPASLSNRQWVDLFSEEGFYRLLIAMGVEKTNSMQS